ncbi:MAG: hypothetical protein ACPHK0_03375 [Dehalococcoidia bacterium]
MTLAQARRNQMLIAGISSVLLIALWLVGDVPTVMYFLLPPVIVAMWISALLAHKQRIGSVRWNLFFGLLGVGVVSTVVRVVLYIGNS